MRAARVMTAAKGALVCECGGDRSPLSLVMVLVCHLPNVTFSAPYRRAETVLSETSPFPQRVKSTFTRKDDENNALVGNTGHFDCAKRR